MQTCLVGYSKPKQDEGCEAHLLILNHFCLPTYVVIPHEPLRQMLFPSLHGFERSSPYCLSRLSLFPPSRPTIFSRTVRLRLMMSMNRFAVS